MIGATYIPEVNPLVVNRVVGYFEYRQALAHLDAFINSATPEELAVAEQIVAQHDEFKVYTNLSRRLETRPNPLAERSDVPNDNFARSGLAWVTALARVELAAMVAGFSSHTQPFLQVRPSSYDAAAHRELVEDGMRTHYWSLARDAVPRSMRRGVTPEPQAIAYVRRTTLALKFLRAVRDGESGLLTTAQQNELDTWEQQLKELQSRLLYDVLGVHDAMVLSSTSFGGPAKELYLHKCGMTREQILDDIRSGRAKINGASPAAMALLQKELKKTTPATTAAPPAAGAAATPPPKR